MSYITSSNRMFCLIQDLTSKTLPMTLFFKMERTLVTFSLTSMLKLRVAVIQMRKGTLYHKIFEKCKLEK